MLLRSDMTQSQDATCARRLSMRFGGKPGTMPRTCGGDFESVSKVRHLTSSSLARGWLVALFPSLAVVHEFDSLQLALTKSWHLEELIKAHVALRTHAIAKQPRFAPQSSRVAALSRCVSISLSRDPCFFSRWTASMSVGDATERPISSPESP